MSPRRCPRCGFTYAWNGKNCGHCHNPFPVRQAWDDCTEPEWFHRHYTGTTFRQFLLFGCAAVRSAERFLTSESEALLRRVEELAGRRGWFDSTEARCVNTELSGYRDRLIHTVPATSPARAVIDALTQLGTVAAGITSVERVFSAALLIATAEALATVPETTDERAPRPGFLDDPRRRARGELLYVGGRPQLMTLTEEEQWERWQHAMERAGQTRLVRLSATRAATAELCDLYRDVVPYPFTPLKFDPEWRTTTALHLARVIRDTRDFGTLPILADALQDAGCENDEILTHCRNCGQHVLGCWVIEAVLSDGG